MSQDHHFLYYKAKSFFLKIFLINLILSLINNNNFLSEVNLVIKGKGNQNLLSNKFEYTPSEVIVNGKSKQCNKTCNLDEEINNITLKFNGTIKSCYFMFRNLVNITEIDLSNFDTSQVTNMESMFHHCENMKKINLENINTSSVETMLSLFDACYKLTSVDLSKFDTSKVKTLRLMFWNCRNLKFLDLSNFDTSQVTDIYSIFWGCESLIYLNINSFKFNKTISRINAFYGIASFVKYCINDTETTNILLNNDTNSNCSDDCFKSNIKIDINNNDCLDSCIKNGYKYEYNNICYDSCPKDTYSLFFNGNNSNNITKECFDTIPEGYYFDSNDTIYKKCFESCKFCYGEGNETNNNCKECKSNYTFLKENDTNCYEICKYNYYFDKSNNYHCTENETCPELYNKLIKEDNKFIDKCQNDNIYKYEFNNRCYINCPNKTYSLIDNEFLCFNEAPEGYYFDSNDTIYKKCFETCKFCYGEGNETNNNCKECKSNFTFYDNPYNNSNCYKTCIHFYYFDELFNINCTENEICPLKYSKLIPDKKVCIKECKNDDIYKYEYNNKCYTKCPNGTFLNDSDLICYKENNSGDNKNEINENIKKFRDYISNYNISKNQDDIVTINNDVIYQITTSDNQKNNTNKNISTIDLGDCEKILKKEYNISESLPLLILKIDYYSPDSTIPIIGYEIYHPISKIQLDLHYCEDILIKLNIPVSIDENNLFKYDPNSGFYTDNCFSYTTENGTDIILNDRKQEFTDNKLSLCENNCNYTGYDKGNKQSSCDCNIKNKMDLINDIFNDQNESSYSFNSDESTSSSSNMVTIKCTKALFSKEGLKNNISSYILIIFITQFIISILLFIKCGYRLLDEDIKNILKTKNKIEKTNFQNNKNTKGGKLKQKENRKNKRKNNFPPKKKNINFINNFNNNTILKQDDNNFIFFRKANSKIIW